MSDPKPEPRGVENPRVIDLVTENPETGEVVLLMLEARPWADEEVQRNDQLKQIEDKFNAYLSYVLGGWLAKDYPQYADKKVSIQLDCASPPQAEQQAFLSAMRNFAESEGLRFALQVVRD